MTKLKNYKYELKFESEFQNISLEYDYLSSAEKLLEYQSLYFEDELVQKNINDIKIYNSSTDTKRSNG